LAFQCVSRLLNSHGNATSRIDLFFRRVVGPVDDATMTALVLAIWRRGKPDALLHESDRGSACGGKPSIEAGGLLIGSHQRRAFQCSMIGHCIGWWQE
jgi:transposase InsO family protein